jgi:hypothetical protein
VAGVKGYLQKRQTSLRLVQGTAYHREAGSNTTYR